MLTLTPVDPQELKSGPASDGTSLWVLAGTAQARIGVNAPPGGQVNAEETFRMLVGPVFQGPVHAIAVVSADSQLRKGRE